MKTIKAKPFFRLVALLLIAGQLLLPLQVQAFSIGEERKISEQLLYTLRQALPIVDSPDISQYINSLGDSVLRTIGPQPFDYHFFVVESNQFNAFAAPGGLVFFYTGLIETMHSEDELVGVLSHEIGHVVSRHIAQRMEKGGKINVLTLLLGAAGLALGVPGLSQGLFTGSMAAGQTLNLQYSRDDEEQSDRLAFVWMQAMHRDPSAMLPMLRTMRRLTRYAIGGEVPQYLLTHPNPEARLSYVQSLLETSTRKTPQPTYKPTDNFNFFRFQYRVMMQTVDASDLRIRCTNTLNSTKSSAEERTMAKYGMALLASDERKLDLALSLLGEVQSAYPQREILEVDRAAIYLTNARPDEAKPLLESACSRNPSDMYAAYLLAKVEMAQGNNSRAETLLQRVSRTMPEYPQPYFDLGQIASNRGQEGLSMFYLAKYNLYRGKIKLTKQYLLRASKDQSLLENQRLEAKNLLDRLAELEKL